MGRTFSIMAEDGELPRLFAKRNANNAPWLAELLLAVIAMILVWTGSFLQVVGISSFSILAYYAIANLAALRQPQSETNRHKAWNWAGLVLCLTLAVSVPVESILPTLASLATLLILRQVLAKPGVSR
jgi:APA family basic amino acid/polyamine antiporter